MKTTLQPTPGLFKQHPFLTVLAAIGAIAIGVAAVLTIRSLSGPASDEAIKPTPTKALVKRAVSGHYVKLENDEKLAYAGIRAPYENEPLHREAKQRNEALVVDFEVRLEYDPQVRDSEGRLVGYAFLGDGSMVNVTLVREGLAYARITPKSTRYADKILAAQTEARLGKRGLWEKILLSADKVVVDPKHAEFHRPSCEVAKKIGNDRRVDLPGNLAAFEKGYAPCNKCLP